MTTTIETKKTADINVAIETLLLAITHRETMVSIYTPPERPKSIAIILKGIVDWLTDEPTVAAGIIEDLARAIEKCDDQEDLRDLSIYMRENMFSYRPAGRAALTPTEAKILRVIDQTI